ncbi:MAG: hypothetical protein ACLQBD_31235 [Syntrophobacteraceae bacterium]
MKKTLYIHLGPPKTGTSAIQRFLSSNDELLSEKGFHYIRACRWDDGGHHPLVWILHYKYSKVYLNILYSIDYVAQQDKLLRDLANEIDSIKEESIILSSEGIPLMCDEAVNDLLDYFPGMSIKAIIYVRDLRELVLSVAAQIIKNQDTTNDDRLSNMYPHIKYFYQYYLSCLNFWGNRIGKENLIFRKYGKEYFKHGSIYADFVDAINLVLTDDFIIPENLQNESLAYAETIYFKDILNRLTLNTHQDILKAQLIAWEKSNHGTKFFLPKDMAIKLEEDATNIHKYLLDNYLDTTYADFFERPLSLSGDVEYKLTYSDFANMVDYMDNNINNFKEDIMESLRKVLDRTYEYELGFREFEVILRSVTRDNKPIALWGCGAVADKLFRNHSILWDKEIYVIDKDIKKQGSYFYGHEILHPSIITDRCIDTVIITSVAYVEEIAKEITEKYPSVECVIKLAENMRCIQQTSIVYLASNIKR